MYSLAPISTRNDFPKLMAGRGLKEGVAVEVGVHRGDFAKILLEQWPKTIHYMGVDPWGCPRGYEDQVQYLWGDKDREADKRQAWEVVSGYNERATMWQYESLDAAKRLRDDSLLFVYLDGDHRYEAVKADIEAWFPKLKPGGILAGLDWMCPGEYDRPDNWGPGIQRAVAEFAGPRELTVWLVPEEGGLPWSFYIIKR